MSSDKKTNTRKIILPVFILLAGIIATLALIKLKPAPEKKERPDMGALVETISVSLNDHRIQVHGTGVVQPGQEVSITSQIGGKIVEVAPSLKAGGFFNKGEVMFRIETADYELAVEQATAGVARAELALATAEGRAEIARAEWRNLKGNAEPNPLTVHEPQLKEARANLASARATLDQARLNLGRTVVAAPFAGRVRSESIGPGKVIKAGDIVAQLAGTGLAEIIVPLPVSELARLKVPRAGGAAAKGSPAVVRLRLNDRAVEWQGYLARSLGEVDEASRMARVVVAVPEPYAASRPMPLETGLFVEVVVLGKTLRQAAAIPRKALRENDTVWLLDNNSRLVVRKVEVLRREEETVYLGAGIAPGDMVVLTNFSGAADGMLLRAANKEQRP